MYVFVFTHTSEEIVYNFVTTCSHAVLAFQTAQHQVLLLFYTLQGQGQRSLFGGFLVHRQVDYTKRTENSSR